MVSSIMESYFKRHFGRMIQAFRNKDLGEVHFLGTGLLNQSNLPFYYRAGINFYFAGCELLQKTEAGIDNGMAHLNECLYWCEFLLHTATDDRDTRLILDLQERAEAGKAFIEKLLEDYNKVRQKAEEIKHEEEVQNKTQISQPGQDLAVPIDHISLPMLSGELQASSESSIATPSNAQNLQENGEKDYHHRLMTLAEASAIKIENETGKMVD